MAIASALGIGSGIDIGGIVRQLIEADSRPAFNAIQRKETAIDDKLSGLGRLKSVLADFGTATGKLKELGVFNQHQVSSSNEDRFTATAGLGAATGSYSLEIQQLAEAHKLTSVGFNGYDDVVGLGDLTLTVDGHAFTITLDNSNNTLEGLRDSINHAADNSGVNASIINVDDNTGGTVSKLVLTSNKTGTANAISVSAGHLSLSAFNYDPSAADNTLTEQNAAQDAIILVDGQTATRNSNSIDDVIQGVTLDLKTAVIGEQLSLNVSLDEENIKTVTDAFVSAYNNLTGMMKDLGRYDAENNNSGALIGSSILRNIQTQVRQAVSNPVSSATSDYNSLAIIGISIDRDGIMSLNNQEFSEALSENLQSVSDVFSSSDGVAARLDTRLNQYLQSGGILDLQTKSLSSQISRFEEERDKVQLRFDNLERVLMKQFIAMDVAVGQFQSTGTYLSQQLAALSRS